jgi:hypothetical protein
MCRAWDPQQPVESLFKQIQHCADYSEAGGVLIGQPQQIKVGYAKIFATGHFMSACRRWNDKHAIKKIGHNSNLFLLPITVIISRCRENPLSQMVNPLPTPPLATLKTKWLKTPLEH